MLAKFKTMDTDEILFRLESNQIDSYVAVKELSRIGYCPVLILYVWFVNYGLEQNLTLVEIQDPWESFTKAIIINLKNT